MSDYPRFEAAHGELICPDSSIVFDNELGRIVATFHSTPDDPFSPLAVRQAKRAEFLAAALNAAPRIRVGDRVVFVRDASTYPVAYVPAGSTGTVTDIVRDDEPYRVEVRMDDPRLIANLLEWDGEYWVQGSEPDDIPESFAHDVIRTTNTPAPMYTLDGHLVDMVEFLRDNQHDPDFDGMVEDIATLDPGQVIVFGGGAAATFILRRVR